MSGLEVYQVALLGETALEGRKWLLLYDTQIQFSC